jgi:hypothetical protein
MIKPFTHVDAKAVFGFKAMPKDRTYLGAEIELETNKNREKVAEEANQYVGKFCIIKNDTSIKNGFEIASAPCGLEFHQRNWYKFFKYCRTTKNLFPAENVGMHVHVSRKYLTPLQVGKILVFINAPENLEFLSLIAGRNLIKHKWCKINHEINSPKWGLKKIRNTMGYDSSAVRFSFRKTLEFRIFSSTISRKIFLKNLEFCHALIKFTRTCFMSIEDTRSVGKFCSFVQDWREEYPNLYSFLRHNGNLT